MDRERGYESDRETQKEKGKRVSVTEREKKERMNYMSAIISSIFAHE